MSTVEGICLYRAFPVPSTSTFSLYNPVDFLLKNKYIMDFLTFLVGTSHTIEFPITNLL